ncbi:MAG: hypothetical protein ACR2JJ_00520 [Sphingomicrobium sp.]
MSRTINLSLDEGAVIAKCQTAKVGVSAIETLPSGGVRLVCMSTDGADRLRRKLKSHLIKGDVARSHYRPRQDAR